eukprot:CAMPEP_0184488712 /NCGR_PEP_ID=MMETSP0113_2-20130426/13099_1 /TAXON_ID=91329 /ORGANISM="Norrisiella sphaerica, Strain BC52" /LENGTH=589 /DNA_ID=CAMNT_0026871675 /DNA_START=170 /DNA_END=1939 /DNA_ORIENTATION=+
MFGSVGNPHLMQGVLSRSFASVIISPFHPSPLLRTRTLTRPRGPNVGAKLAEGLTITSKHAPRYSMQQLGFSILRRGLSASAKQGKAIEEKQSTITPRDQDYSQWYLDVISEAELIENSPVKGCMVIRPTGMALWENIRDEMDKRIKATGTQNAYFPLFIPQSFLSKEAEHVEGFAKECAVVTHHRLRNRPDGAGLEPDPDSKLEEPLIVRPTSETMIWYMFKNWIQSHRDLPLKINQWANVVRWELRTRPFLRSAEFLWQEGHTAHATEKEAIATAEEMLEVYEQVARDLLAIPVIPGKKSAIERFAGAADTYTIEAMMQNGWALQSGTSHFLGQNFAKAFDVQFSSETENREFVWATSWGVSTRLLGALIMTHSDDSGLVLPPKVAPVQVVLIPIVKATGGEEITNCVSQLAAKLKAAGIRVHIDDRQLRPGNKYYHWERRGVPFRMEIGARDLKKGSAFCARRIDGKKSPLQIKTEDGDWTDVAAKVQAELDSIQTDMLRAATERRDANTFRLETYDEMKAKLSKEEYGFFLVPWAADDANEEAIKADCRATIRCYPLKSQAEAEGKTCFYSGKPATHMAIFARAY